MSSTPTTTLPYVPAPTRSTIASRRRRGVGAIVALAAVAAACGDSGEQGLEQLIERETGEDLELDLGGDGFSLETDEGSFSVDEEGNVVIVGPDGEVITGNVDVDGNTINLESDEGDLTIEGDADGGSLQITGDDGEVSFSTSQDIPDEWPAEVPRPTGLEVVAGSVFDDGANRGVIITGTTSATPSEFLDAYGPMLEAAGFARTLFFQNGEDLTAGYEDGDWSVSVSGAVGPAGGTGASTINVAVSKLP